MEMQEPSGYEAKVQEPTSFACVNKQAPSRPAKLIELINLILTSGVYSLMLRASMSIVSSISPESGEIGERAPLFCFLAFTCSLSKVGTGRRF